MLTIVGIVVGSILLVLLFVFTILLAMGEFGI